MVSTSSTVLPITMDSDANKGEVSSPPRPNPFPLAGRRPRPDPTPGTTCKRQRISSPTPQAGFVRLATLQARQVQPVNWERLLPNAAGSRRLQQYALSGTVLLTSKPNARSNSSSSTVLTSKRRCLGAGYTPSTRVKRRGSQSSQQPVKRQAMLDVASVTLSLPRPPDELGK